MLNTALKSQQWTEIDIFGKRVPNVDNPFAKKVARTWETVRFLYSLYWCPLGCLINSLLLFPTYSFLDRSLYVAR